MRYLLDSHAFLWWDMSAEKLSPRVFALFQDESNTLLLSLASVWEIQIKQQLGKLKLRESLEQTIEDQQAHYIELLPITLSHILALENLPQHHRDPFDRLLIAQAQIEQIPLLSNDPIFAKYPVQVIW